MKTLAYFKLRHFYSLFIILLPAIFFNCGVVDPDPFVDNNNYSATETFSFTVDGSSKSKLQITSINGPVEITGVSGQSSVMISGEKKVESESEADAKNHLQDLEVRISESGDQVSVESVHPKENYGRNYSVAYKIFVPETWRVNADLTNGEISVDSLRGNLQIDLTNGNVFLTQTQGNLYVRLTNGQVNGKCILPNHGSFDIETTNGAINMAIPQTTSAGLSVEVTNGNVRVSNLTVTNMTSSTKKFQGKLGNGEGNIRLKTTNGNILLSGF